MQPHLVGLVLTSAALHAVWNARLKGRADPGAAGFWVVVGAALLSAVLALLTGQASLPEGAWLWTACAGLVEGIYFASLLTALRNLPLPLAYGVSRGAGVLLSWPLAMLWVHEKASPRALLGAGILSLGLGLAAVGRGGAQPDEGQARAGWAATWVCALSISAYPLVYQQALHAHAPPFALFTVSLALSLPIQWVWLGRGARGRLARELSQQPYLLVGAALLCAASFLLLLAALSEGGAAHLSALRNTSVLVATALAAREQRLGRLDWLRASLVSAGAVLVAW